TIADGGNFRNSHLAPVPIKTRRQRFADATAHCFVETAGSAGPICEHTLGVLMPQIRGIQLISLKFVLYEVEIIIL
ncbi:MAG: hypothetical protein AAFV51_13455, partial [Pseudomonadota bacterium]